MHLLKKIKEKKRKIKEKKSKAEGSGGAAHAIVGSSARPLSFLDLDGHYRIARREVSRIDQQINVIRK